MNLKSFFLFCFIFLVVSASLVYARASWSFQDTPDAYTDPGFGVGLWRDSDWTTADLYNESGQSGYLAYVNYTIPAGATSASLFKYRYSQGRYTYTSATTSTVAITSWMSQNDCWDGTLFRVKVNFLVDNTSSPPLNYSGFSFQCWDYLTSDWSLGAYPAGYYVSGTKFYEEGMNWSTFLPDYKPMLTTPSLVPTLPTKLTPVNASTTYTDANADVGNVTFKWYVNKLNIYNQTFTSINNNTVVNSSLGTGNFSHFQVVNVSVQAFDIVNSSVIVWSTQLNISNTIPVIGNPTLNNTSPSIIDTLNCNAGSFTDADGDTAQSYDWLWYKNNASLAITTQTLTISGNAVKFDNISCQERAYDGYNYSNYANSTQSAVLNTIPSISSQNVFTNNTLGHSFNVTATALDYDGATDIIKTNISVSSGSCDQALNSSSTNYFNVTYNCSGTSGNSSTIIIGFQDVSGGYVGTTPTSNEYPNHQPTVSADTLTPITPTIASTLTGGCTASDPDGDTLTYYYNFYSITDATYKGSFSTTATYGLSPPLDSHDTFRVDCYVTDAYGSQSATRTGTTQRTVSNTVPTINSPTITPTSANISTVLTCNDGGNYTDVDGDTRGTNQWLWYKNNATTGITTTTFTISGNAVRGDWIKCQEKTSDGIDLSLPYNSSMIQIQNTIPTVPATLTLNNTIYVSQILTAIGSGSTDDDSDSLSYLFSFYSITDAASRQNYSLTQTYTIQTTDAHDILRVRVLANDSAANSSSYKELNITINNSIPSSPTIGVNVSTIYVGQSVKINASSSTDADSDSLIYLYQFYNYNDSTVKQAYSSTQTYTIAQTDKRDMLGIRSKADDGYSNSSYTEQNISVLNSVPVIGIPSLNNSVPTLIDTVKCNAGSFTDTDGDTAQSYEWLWFKNNFSTDIVSQTFKILGNATHLDNISCQERAYDGFSYSNYANSTIIQILNNNPSIFLENTFADVVNTHRFNVTAGVFDADGASDISNINITFKAGTCSNPINTTSGNYLNVTYNCSGTGSTSTNIVIKFTDLTGTTNSTTSSAHTYPNNPPTWNQAIVYIGVYHSSVLSLQLNATDLDSDTLTWAVNSTIVTLNQTGYMNDTPALSETGNYSLRVNVTDGVSVILMNIPYEIKNYLPTFTQSPPSFLLYHNQNLSIQFNATDLDSDALTWGTNSSLFTINTTGYVFDNPTQAETGNYSIKVNITDSLATATLIWTYEVMNRGPSGGEINITPILPIDADDLVCNIKTAITDADGDPLTNTFNWYKNTASQSINDQNLGNGNTTTSDVWYCTLYVNDGLANSPTIQSQSVSIASGNVAPTINATNATTALTGIISNAANPTNNNSWVNLSVTFHDPNANEVWSVYFCKSGAFSSTCTGGEYCHSANASAYPTVTCRFDLASETATALNYWVFVMDNTTLSSNTAGSFSINYPPTTPTLSPTNHTWITATSTTLTPSSTDPDSDVVTYYVYANHSLLMPLVNTTVSTFSYAGLNETTYYWQVMANDSHGYTSALSLIYDFRVDYTTPTIENISISSSPYYTDTTIMVYADCADYNSLVNTSSVKYNITDILALTTNENMAHYTLNNYRDTYVPLGVAGTYSFKQFICSDLAGNTANKSSNITFTTSIRPVAGGGGGGGSSVITILSTTSPNNTILHYRGDGKCECYLVDNNQTYCENSGNTLSDCPIKFDNLVTCMFTDPKTCLYSEQWFVNILIGVIFVAIVYIMATQKGKIYKPKRERGD